jgi:hypothetical protein
MEKVWRINRLEKRNGMEEMKEAAEVMASVAKPANINDNNAGGSRSINNINNSSAYWNKYSVDK